MNAQELFEHLVYKNVGMIPFLFLNLSVNGRCYAEWDGKVWEILSYENSDDISVSEYV